MEDFNIVYYNDIYLLRQLYNIETIQDIFYQINEEDKDKDKIGGTCKACKKKK